MTSRSRCGPKIVLLGGGSYTWSPHLLCDILHEPALADAEVVLLDIHLPAANEILAAGETMARTLGKPLRLHVTDSHDDAFRDADFVIITISTGDRDFELMARDLAIPETYGILQTVGDTVGPGGWSRALRNVPVLVDLGQRLERVAPRAMVLNYSNPMAVLTGALCAATQLRTVGLCHGVFLNYKFLQTLLGVEERDLTVNFGGVNHFFWMLDFLVKGLPGYPLLRQRLGGKTIDECLREGETDVFGHHSSHALCAELFAEYGYLPFVADRHTSEFLPGYLTAGQVMLDRYRLVRTTIADRRRLRALHRQQALDLAAGKQPPFPKSRETAVDMITAIMTQRPFSDVVNLPNHGQIDDLPRNAVVETLGLVDALGFRPIAAGRMPDALHPLVARHCHVQNMTLQAALTGNQRLALEALTLDPLCSHLPPSRVRAMGLELMESARSWLPQFQR